MCNIWRGSFCSAGPVLFWLDPALGKWVFRSKRRTCCLRHCPQPTSEAQEKPQLQWRLTPKSFKEKEQRQLSCQSAGLIEQDTFVSLFLDLRGVKRRSRQVFLEVFHSWKKSQFHTNPPKESVFYNGSPVINLAQQTECPFPEAICRATVARRWSCLKSHRGASLNQHCKEHGGSPKLYFFKKKHAVLHSTLIVMFFIRHHRTARRWGEWFKRLARYDMFAGFRSLWEKRWQNRHVVECKRQ